MIRRWAWALGVLTSACVADDAPALEAPAPRWPCPEGWVAAAQGGCGPAALLCAAGGGAAGGACDGVDLSRAPALADVDGAPFTGFARATDGSLLGAWPAPGGEGGPPAVDWLPSAPEGVPDGSWRPTPPRGNCPAGWAGSVATGCEPALRSDCGEDGAPLPGGACLSFADRACPTDAWPAPAAGVDPARVRRVRTGAPDAGADGSEAHPFPSLASALTGAAGELWVLLAAGEHAVPEALPSDLHVLGACAARVALVAPSDAAPTRAAVEVGAGARLELRGVAVRAPGVAVRVRGGAASLARVRIAASTGAAVDASAGARVDLTDALVEGVRADAAGASGVVTRDATVTARRTVLRRIPGRAFVATGATSSLALDDVTVQDIAGGGDENVGVDLTAGASAALRRVALRAVRDRALFAYGGATRAALEDVRVEGMMAGRGAYGVTVEQGASVTAARLSFADLRGMGALVQGPGSEATFEDSTWRRVVGEARAGGAAGIALGVQLGARATVRRGVVREVSGIGAYIRDARTALSLEEVALLGTDAGGLEVVLGVERGATATLAGVYLQGGRGRQIFAQGAASRVVADRLALSGADPDPAEPVAALMADEGGALELSRVRVSAVGSLHVNAINRGAVALRDAVLDGARDDGDAPGGVVAGSGGSVTLRRVIARGHGAAGVQAETGGEVTMEDCLVTGVRETAGSNGGANGVGALSGSALTMRRCVVAEAEGILANVFGRLTLEDCVLRDAAPAPSGLTGMGLEAAPSAVVEGARVRVSRARDVAVLVSDVRDSPRGAAGDFHLSDSVIEDTQLGPRRPGVVSGGIGVFARDGAHVSLERTEVTGSLAFGVYVGGEGTTLALRGARVGETLASQGFGLGVHLRDGATGTLTGTLIEWSVGWGLWAHGRGTRATLDEVLVRGVADGGQYRTGVGVLAAAGAAIEGRRVSAVDVGGIGLVAMPGQDTRDVPLANRAGSSLTVRGAFVRSVRDAAVEAPRTTRRLSYGAVVEAGCAASLSDFTLDDVGWGFLQNLGDLSLSRGVVSRWRSGAGIANGDDARLRASSLAVRPAGDVARDVRLPELLLAPPPEPCAEPPCDRR